MIEQIGLSLVTTLGLLFITFVGPVAAMIVLSRRKRAVRAARRSPLTADLLRPPGYTLREKIEDIRMDVAFDVAILMVIPTLMTALYLLQRQINPRPPSAWVAVVLAVGVLWIVARWTLKLHRQGGELDRLRSGLDAEMAAGQELDQLMRKGAIVYHDFPADKFNIDHIVIAPQGVFCVETKGYTKPRGDGGTVGATVEFDGQALRFPWGHMRKPLEQAERQAQWFSKWLSTATGSAITALPVLALPGWYVDRKGRGAVRVFSGRELHDLLKAGGQRGLTPEEIRRAAYQVEQRCRSVKPAYGPEDGS